MWNRARAAVAAATAGVAVGVGAAPGAAESSWVQAAERAAMWIDHHRVETPGGATWPADPEDEANRVTNLYAGSCGVALFFLELAARTDDERWRREAEAGADHLLATLAGRLEEMNAGLYTGAAGIGFTLHRAYERTGHQRYREGALRCARMIRESANPAGAGVDWNGVTDIIGGAAGTGLFLLYAAEELGDEASRDVAAAAGDRLIEVAIPTEDGGFKWFMTKEFERLMPNFSHGTAGVAFFLARLHEATGEERFLEAAKRGAAYLQSVAETEGGVCRVMHHEPGGEDLFYLGWCHGPAGTARLFMALERITGEQAWGAWTRRAAETIRTSGVPEERTPGFWNNVGVCCGSAGVADFFMDLYEAEGRAEDLAFARELMRDALERATEDRASGGLKWVHAEHRVRPEFLVAQTGLMQGAAGIGLTLLRLDAQERGRGWELRLPDDVDRDRGSTHDP